MTEIRTHSRPIQNDRLAPYPPQMIDHPQLRGEPEQAVTPDDYSFNEDMDWILDKLTDRLGGSLGLVSRFSSIGPEYSTLGLRNPGKTAPARDALVEAITGHMREASASNRRRRGDDAAEVNCFELDDPDGGRSGHYILSMPFDVSPHVRLVVSVARPMKHGRRFGPLALATARTFYPVLSRYFKLWWMHRTERGQTRILSRALNCANVGVLVLDAGARVLFANSLALEVADGGLGLHLRGRTLSAHHLDDDVRLQSALQHAIRGGGADEPSPVVAIHDDNSHRPLIVSVAQTEEPVLDMADAAAIVYILDPEQEATRLLAPICAIYGLTPVETTLGCLIVDGQTVKEAARNMNIQPSTARTYLKQIFSKTMTNRQAELVRVLLSSALRMRTTNGFTTV